MEILLISLAALIIGFLAGTLLLRLLLRDRFEARLSQAVQQRFDEWRERELEAQARRLHEAWMAQSRDQIAQEALRRSSATIKGQIGERFAPLLPDFQYEPADARFLGNPVDYVVFDGLTEGQIRGIVFVEVKTGNATLTPYQRQARDAITTGRVAWRLLSIPEMVLEREPGRDGAD